MQCCFCITANIRAIPHTMFDVIALSLFMCPSPSGPSEPPPLPVQRPSNAPPPLRPLCTPASPPPLCCRASRASCDSAADPFASLPWDLPPWPDTPCTPVIVPQACLPAYRKDSAKTVILSPVSGARRGPTGDVSAVMLLPQVGPSPQTSPAGAPQPLPTALPPPSLSRRWTVQKGVCPVPGCPRMVRGPARVRWCVWAILWHMSAGASRGKELAMGRMPLEGIGSHDLFEMFLAILSTAMLLFGGR